MESGSQYPEICPATFYSGTDPAAPYWITPPPTTGEDSRDSGYNSRPNSPEQVVSPSADHRQPENHPDLKRKNNEPQAQQTAAKQPRTQPLRGILKKENQDKASPKPAAPTKAPRPHHKRTPRIASSQTARSTKEASPASAVFKLADAPHINIDFPCGNLTLAEICAYLPNSLKAQPMVQRLATNGVSHALMTKMVNRYRNLFGEITRIKFGQDLTTSLQTDKDVPWTFAWARDNPPPGWNHNSLDVTGYQPRRVTTPSKMASWNRIIPGIPFKDLVKGVKHRPTGYDALDLTRCIDYHLQHPDEKWIYPDDMATLVKCLGGPMQPTLAHSDRESAIRHDIAYALEDLRGLDRAGRTRKLVQLKCSIGWQDYCRNNVDQLAHSVV